MKVINHDCVSFPNFLVKATFHHPHFLDIITDWFFLTKKNKRKKKVLQKGIHLGPVASLTEESKEAHQDSFYLYDLWRLLPKASKCPLLQSPPGSTSWVWSNVSPSLTVKLPRCSYVVMCCQHNHHDTVRTTLTELNSKTNIRKNTTQTGLFSYSSHLLKPSSFSHLSEVTIKFPAATKFPGTTQHWCIHEVFLPQKLSFICEFSPMSY